MSDRLIDFLIRLALVVMGSAVVSLLTGWTFWLLFLWTFVMTLLFWRLFHWNERAS